MQRCYANTTATPLAETIERLSALNPYLTFLAEQPQGEGWHLASGLCDPAVLGGWHAELTSMLGDRRVAAAYQSNWLISILVGAWLLPALSESRLPGAGLDGVMVHRNDGGWFDGIAIVDPSLVVLMDDPAAGLADSDARSGRDELIQALAVRLLDLESIVNALRDACPIGLPALWGAVADAVVSQSLRLASMIGGDRRVAWQDATSVLDWMAARQPRMRVRPSKCWVEYERGTELFEVRGTCCLYYRTVENPDRDGEGYCDSCPLRSDESRVERMRASLATL